jgi:signal transduction histidine kinase/ligand-binding sensor domain-containing protein
VVEADVFRVCESMSDRESDRNYLLLLLRCLRAARFTILFLWFCTAGLLAHAQFRSTQWTADSGLPQNIVRGIAQTPDGYLWLATLNGAARFDGVRFTVFDKSNSPGITTNRFAAMALGAGGDLWLPSEGGSITRYHDGHFHTLGPSEGVLHNTVGGITSDGRGGVWIIQDGAILHWNDGAGRFESMIDSARVQYSSLSWVGTGFWGVRDQRLYCFVRGQLSSYALPSDLSVTTIKKVAVGTDGAVWLDLPNRQFARLVSGGLQRMSGSIETILNSSTTTSWKVTIGEHLDRTLLFPSGGLEKGIPYNAILEDDEHNIWVGSEGQGLYRIQRQTIHTYSIAQGLAGANIYPVFASSDGDLWVGTWPAGLTRFHEGQLKTYTPENGIPGLVTALGEDSAGNLWIGTHAGLITLSPQGRFQAPANLPGDLPLVQAILKMRDGTLLFGMPVGIYKYDGVKGAWLHPRETMPVGDVRVMIQSRNGDVWFGGYDGLTRISNGAMTRWTEKDGLPSNSVRSIYEDAQGVLWVGTYDGGLGRFSDGRWTSYNRKNGLFDNGVFQILEDSHANLWMSSNRGLYRASKQQLNDVAAGRERRITTVSFGRGDGLLNVECNGGLWPAGAKDKDGKLWFPTQEGVAVVDPESVSTNEHPPKVMIESVALEHAPVDHDRLIRIKPRQESLEIQYTAFSFSRPEQIAFRYKMEGLESEWEDAGYRRTAYYSHLPPGEYVFRVMAVNSDGVWSTNQSELAISVLPPFYRTWWFIASVSALVLFSIWILWGFRVSQLKAVQSAQQAFSQQLIASQEKERSRISAELHDSLGQHLIIIKNLALFLLRPKGLAQSVEEHRETIEEISAEASQAIDETRAISYDLRPFQLDRLGLSKAIEALTRSASRATEIRFSAHVADIDQSFPEELRINFYRIVQEGINNILKHSGASEAEIRVEKNGQVVTLSIRDNGKGLSTEQRAFTPAQGGFGLTGIRERAALLDGAVSVQSEPGNGALLKVIFGAKKNRG